ncbi:MAG: hypothetical protein RL318_1012 [Fibrobacterota bacterium]
MTLDPQTVLIFKIGSGLFWTLVYLLVLYRGWKDRTYGMPLAALGANLGWEFIFSFVFPHASPQLEVNRVWFLFDMAILVQTFLYGRSSQHDPWVKSIFPWMVVGWVAMGTLLVAAVTLEFQDMHGMYAAFGQNLMMSILFVTFLIHRGSSAGQSLWIALFKLIGTVLPSILFHFKYPDTILLNTLFVLIFLFDCLYLGLLWRRLVQEGGKVWGRW